MDDDAMLRLDPLLAEAFRSQMKKSSNIKIINEKLHHQFRVLDLIESLIKKDERMRFVLVSGAMLIFILISLKSISSDQYSSIDRNADQFPEHSGL